MVFECGRMFFPIIIESIIFRCTKSNEVGESKGTTPTCFCFPLETYHIHLNSIRNSRKCQAIYHGTKK